MCHRVLQLPAPGESHKHKIPSMPLDVREEPPYTIHICPGSKENIFESSPQRVFQLNFVLLENKQTNKKSWPDLM